MEEPRSGARESSDVQREVHPKVATPTPWTVEFTNEHAPDLAYIRAANRQEVAVVYASELMPHVPPLLAVAPDLLSALKWLVEKSCMCDVREETGPCSVCRRCDPIIARAEGRES